MTDPTNAVPAPAPLFTGRLEGRRAFTDLVRHALEMAAHQAWPSLVLSDADFLDWPLGERAVVMRGQDGEVRATSALCGWRTRAWCNGVPPGATGWKPALARVPPAANCPARSGHPAGPWSGWTRSAAPGWPAWIRAVAWLCGNGWMPAGTKGRHLSRPLPWVCELLCSKWLLRNATLCPKEKVD